MKHCGRLFLAPEKNNIFCSNKFTRRNKMTRVSVYSELLNMFTEQFSIEWGQLFYLSYLFTHTIRNNNNTRLKNPSQ